MLGFLKTTKKDSGDTLIEVLFAVTVFSFIVVSALTLMNQGIAASQRSLEITLVRQQMDGQAEALRFLHESYVEAYRPGTDTSYPANTPAEEYRKIIDYAIAANRPEASSFGGATCVVPSSPTKDFVMNPVTAKMVNTTTKSNVFKKPDTFSQLTYQADGSLDFSYGIWVEAVRKTVAGASAGYIDFHIRACWDSLGSDQPMNLGTIVRLYEPRG